MTGSHDWILEERRAGERRLWVKWWMDETSGRARIGTEGLLHFFCTHWPLLHNTATMSPKVVRDVSYWQFKGVNVTEASSQRHLLADALGSGPSGLTMPVEVQVLS